MQYIGYELKNRMDMLGIDVSALSEMTFMDEDVIRDIIADTLAYEEIDEFDMSLICSALHCDTVLFIVIHIILLMVKLEIRTCLFQQ